MGIGMVAVLSASHAAHVRERLLAAGEEAVVIGELRPGSGVQIV
jgi:phosphoribosylaminoimidazole (AIR) synthetase